MVIHHNRIFGKVQAMAFEQLTAKGERNFRGSVGWIRRFSAARGDRLRGYTVDFLRATGERLSGSVRDALADDGLSQVPACGFAVCGLAGLRPIQGDFGPFT